MVENNLRHFVEYGIVEIKLYFLADYIGDYQSQQRRIVVQNGQNDPHLPTDLFHLLYSLLCMFKFVCLFRRLYNFPGMSYFCSVG